MSKSLATLFTIMSLSTKQEFQLMNASHNINFFWSNLPNLLGLGMLYSTIFHSLLFYAIKFRVNFQCLILKQLACLEFFGGDGGVVCLRLRLRISCKSAKM